MSYCLSTGGSGPFLLCNGNGWVTLFTIGREYGWQPTGTEIGCWFPNDGQGDTFEEAKKNWDGTYFSNDGQLVTAEDSANLLIALKKARMDVAAKQCNAGSCAERCITNPTLATLMDQLIVICEHGEFCIW